MQLDSEFEDLSHSLSECIIFYTSIFLLNRNASIFLG